MKVLHLINSLNTGGAEKLLLESLPLYNKKKIQGDLLLLNSKEYPFLTDLIKQKSCMVYSLGQSSVYKPFLIFKIIPYLRKYDLIHAHLFPSLYWLALAKMFSFSSTKIIYTEHSTHNKRRNNLLSKVIDKFIYQFYNSIITIADEVDQNLKQHLGFNKARYKLINNGVNTKIYQNAQAYKKDVFFSENDIILIQVSSFRFPKDQLTLIHSLTKLPQHFKLLLVGEGPLLEDNKNLVINLNLQERVKFLGIRMDVPRLLKTADIVVLSSHHEGLSLSSIEAMASGRPFIASDVPGLREIVKDAGLLFPKKNSKRLSIIIKQLTEDKVLYDETVKKCELKAQEFDIEKMVDKYIELYESVLKK